MNATDQMTSNEAAEFAPLWGSMVRSGDPGACMYGFSGGDAHKPKLTDNHVWLT